MSVVIAYALRESLRRRVFAVMLALTVAFLCLFTAGSAILFDEVAGFAFSADVVEARTLAASTILGLSMFVTLFLGAVLAIFLTVGAVRGDAERGLIQPLVVRPVGRGALVGGRFAAGAIVSGGYAAGMYAACVVIVGLLGGWWPSQPIVAGVGLVVAIASIAALSLLGSVFLSTVANGIAVFMLFGAGLVAGLLGQVGEALGSPTLARISEAVALALPFEALYQDALSALTVDISGITGFAVNLGPFGGAREGGIGLWLWSVAYIALVLLATRAAFARRDL